MNPKKSKTRRYSFVLAARLLLTALIVLLPAMTATAQSRELSLADLLIGLRSQKVPLPERNKILTEAVRERGITFTYTPEIEKELSATGASPELLAAIREKGAPAPKQPELDYVFFQRRAIDNAAKGEYTLALADFDKAAELHKDDPLILLGRGRAYYNLKSYEKSVADFDRVIELSPKDAAAFISRGAAYEKIGNFEKAAEDYKRSVELEPDSETAKANLKRVQDELAKLEAARRAEEKAKADAEAARLAAIKAQEEAAAEPPRPEFLNVGTLTAKEAERLVTPIYPQIAMRSNIEGKVTVEVELDEKGEVTTAQAISGPKLLHDAAEYAAKRSKFKPIKFNNQPIKAKGVMIYNFSLHPREEE